MIPKPSITTPARVVRVLDGDTIEVEIVRRLRIRMLDCWAPETRTADPEEKRRGLAAKEALAATLPIGNEVILQIPTDPGGDVSDVLTLNRFLAHVWPMDGIPMSAAERQVVAGHATREKS